MCYVIRYYKFRGLYKLIIIMVNIIFNMFKENKNINDKFMIKEKELYIGKDKKECWYLL